MYEATTRGIKVSVEPYYLDGESDPEQLHFFWAYRVVIENHGGVAVQLKSRHWQITDGAGKTEEVRGPGVVGEQPVLNPGDSFEYTSGCPLTTSSGFMSGSYMMQANDGETFDVVIPAFSLDLPDPARTFN